MCLDAVGAPVIIVALVSVAFDKLESQENTALSCIRQIALSPKLSNDHIPGSNTKSPDAASPQPIKDVVLVIVAPPLCAAAVVPPTPLVTPVSSPVVAIPV